MSQGLNQQLKLDDAIRFLRERNRYALDRPVQKRNVRPPILTVWRQCMQHLRANRQSVDRAHHQEV